MLTVSWVQPKTRPYVRGAGSSEGHFEGDLQLDYLDGRSWKLLRSFAYVTSYGLRIELPKGFETDFASIPRVFWSVLPPTGDHGPAAAVHDFLYRRPVPVSRRMADVIFLEAMGVLGVSRFKRYLMYCAVRLFGHKAFITEGRPSGE